MICFFLRMNDLKLPAVPCIFGAGCCKRRTWAAGKESLKGWSIRESRPFNILVGPQASWTGLHCSVSAGLPFGYIFVSAYVCNVFLKKRNTY